MTTPLQTSRFYRTVWVSLGFAAIVVLLNAVTAYGQCPAITNHGWPQRSVVRFYFDAGFNDEQKRQIRAATTEWSRANSINNSKVNFVEDFSGQNFSLRFQVGALAPGNPAVFTGTYDGTTGTVKTGIITYDPNNAFPGSSMLIADPAAAGYSTVVTKLVLHEMGHLMGLDHPAVPANVCDQPDGATVMNYACGINDQGNNLTTTITACDQNGINSESIYPSTGSQSPVFQIDPPSVANPFNEASGYVQIVVTRTGDVSSAATVKYASSDGSGLNECNVFTGMASSRCDYATSIGTLRYAAGETSKLIIIPLVDDSYAEGNETFNISISSPTGAGLGSPTTATITITDNDAVTGVNPIDRTDFFIRQHYIDFLGRLPDPAFQAWQDILNNCAPGNTSCDRVEVSAGFFRSPEFQDRGYFIYRFYSAVGTIPHYNEFMPDFATVSGFLSAQQLEDQKVAFIADFMTRPAFQTKYGALTDPATYVDALLQTVGLPNHPSRQTWITGLTNGSLSRAQVLRALTESAEMYTKYYNEAFVIMQYFGYLRRDADISYLAWIGTMNSTGDYRVMISGFINSLEYRRRFGP